MENTEMVAIGKDSVGDWGKGEGIRYKLVGTG